MSDLISRKEAIKKIVGLNMQVYEGDACVGIRTCLTKEEIIYAIDEIPSAEPERKKGECTKINCPIQMDYISNDCDIKTCPYRTEKQIGKWKNVALFTRECSECGAQIHELEYDNFCPNCGADMRGEHG